MTPEEFIGNAIRRAQREVRETGGWTSSVQGKQRGRKLIPSADSVTEAWETITRALESIPGGWDALAERMLGQGGLSLPQAIQGVTPEHPAPVGRPHRGKRPRPRKRPMKATALVSRKIATRMAELNRVLQLKGRHRFGEVLLADALEEIASGEIGIVMDGWAFEDPDSAATNLLAIGARWAREDAKLPSDGKEGAKP